MHRRSLIVLSLLAAIGCGLLWFWPRGVKVAGLGPTRTIEEQEPGATIRTAPVGKARQDPGETRAPTIATWLRDLLRGQGEVGAEKELNEAEQHTCRLKGTLVVKDKPWIKVPGMRVRLTRTWFDTVAPSQERLPEELFLVTEAETDRWGRFALEEVPLRHTLFLVFQREGRLLEIYKVKDFPLAGRTKDLGELELHERGAIRGRVVDAEGKPARAVMVRAVDDAYDAGPARDQALHSQRVLAAASFRPDGRHRGQRLHRSVRRRDRFLPFPRTATDGLGRFVLHGVRAGAVSLLFNNKRSFGAEDDVLVEAEETTDVGSVFLRSGKVRTIQLLDSREKSLVGATVSVQPADRPVALAEAVTDHKGFCTVFLPEGTRSFSVYFKRRGFRLWEKPEDSWERSEVRMVCRAMPSYALPLRVIDNEGDAIPEAEVALVAADQVFGRKVVFGWLDASDTEAGLFTLPEIPGGAQVEIVAMAPGHAPAVQAFKTQTDWWGLHEIELRLQPAVSIHITTTDRQGEPLAGSLVTAMFLPPRETVPKPGEHWHQLSDSRAVVLGRTNEDGVLVVNGLWKGRIDLAATYPGYTQSPTPVFDLRPNMAATLKLRRGARLDGRLLLDGKQPLRRYEIHATPREYFSIDFDSNPFFGRHRTVTAPDGSFYFNDLYQGAWVLQILPPASPLMPPVDLVWPEGETKEVFVEAQRRIFEVVNLKRKQEPYLVRGRVRLEGRPSDAALYVGINQVELPKTEEERLRPPGMPLERWERYKSLLRQKRALKRQKQPRSKQNLTPVRTLAAVPVGPEGNFELRMARPGHYLVSLKAVMGHRPQVFATRLVELTADKKEESLSQEFSLPVGDLRLILIDTDRRRLARRILNLRQVATEKRTSSQLQSRVAQPGAVLRARSDSDGVIDLKGIPAGTYAIENTTELSGLRPRSFQVEQGTFSLQHLRMR